MGRDTKTELEVCLPRFCCVLAAGAMAIVKARERSDILKINRESEDWTIRVHVVERHREQIGKGSGGKPGRRYRRYVFADEWGNRVSGIVYENDLRLFEHTLLPFKRYDISNAGLLDAVAFFKVGPCNFTWVLDYKKLIEPVDEPVPPLLPVTYPVLSFLDFWKHADMESSFNVKAIVAAMMPRKRVNKKSTQREIVIVDESKIPVIMTLWDEFGDEEGLELERRFTHAPIIVATNVKATTFHGLSLSTRKYSYFLIDPPLADNAALLEWYARNKDDIGEMIKKEDYENASVLYPPPFQSDLITVSAAVAALPLRKTAWVVGKPKVVLPKKAYWAHTCQACRRRFDIPLEWVFKCPKCSLSLGVEVSARVPIELTEGDSVLYMTLKSPDVELLTGITPQQLKDSDEFGLKVEEDLKVQLEKLQLVCFLREPKNKDEDGSSYYQPNHYALLKTYNATDLKKHEASTTIPPELQIKCEDTKNLDAAVSEGSAQSVAMIESSGESTTITESSGKSAAVNETSRKHTEENEKQFFTPTAAKVLREIQEEHTAKEVSHPSPPAKRNLDFISPNAECDKGNRALPSEANASAAPLEPPFVESPIKKNKEKMELN